MAFHVFLDILYDLARRYFLIGQTVNIMMSSVTVEENGFVLLRLFLGVLQLSAVTDIWPLSLMRKEQSTRDISCDYCIQFENAFHASYSHSSNICRLVGNT